MSREEKYDDEIDQLRMLLIEAETIHQLLDAALDKDRHTQKAAWHLVDVSKKYAKRMQDNLDVIIKKKTLSGKVASVA